MKRREIAILDRQHPLVAILRKVVDPKEAGADLEAGRKLAACLLDGAIQANRVAERKMYPSLLVSCCPPSPPLPSLATSVVLAMAYGQRA